MLHHDIQKAIQQDIVDYARTHYNATFTYIEKQLLKVSREYKEDQIAMVQRLRFEIATYLHKDVATDMHMVLDYLVEVYGYVE